MPKGGLGLTRILKTTGMYINLNSSRATSGIAEAVVPNTWLSAFAVWALRHKVETLPGPYKQPTFLGTDIRKPYEGALKGKVLYSPGRV